MRETSELPRGWSLVPLGELVRPIRPRVSPRDANGLSFIGMEHVESQTMRLLGTVPASTMKSNAVRFEAGDVLYGRLRPYLNKVYQPDFAGLGSAEFIVLPPNEAIDGGYLKYVLNSPSFVGFAAGLNTGDRPRVDFEQIAAYEVPLPPTISDQRRVVAAIEAQISRIDSATIALRRASTNLELYRQSSLRGILAGVDADRAEGAVAGPNGQALLAHVKDWRQARWIEAKGLGRPYVQPAEPGDAADLNLPDGWALTTLEQITDPIRTIGYGILMPKEHVPDGVPYVRVKDMRGDVIDLDGLRRTSPEIAAAYVRSTLERGDLLLAIRGSYGRVAEVPAELDGGNITQDTARLAITPLVDRRFVASVLRGPYAQAFLRSVARGVAVRGVNIGDLRRLPVPLPPLAEQQAIVAEVDRRLSTLDVLEREAKASLSRALPLRSAILRTALSGRLNGEWA